NIPGAANENLLITNVQALDAAAYDVVVSSDGGSISSTLARLTVVSPYAGTFMFGATAYSVSETGRVAWIEVMRTGSSNGPATVDFGTGDGTAQVGQDYLSTAGTIYFADGET